MANEQSNLHAPVLLLGGSGMLGRAWRELLQVRAITYSAPSHLELDLKSDEFASIITSGRFTTVVNCAAWTDVDGAEVNESEATDLNGSSPGTLARSCQKSGATLVHYSTDYVFNGTASEPYKVDEPRCPINAYGRSKAVGEAQIEESGCRHLTIRTSWLYAPWGGSFVRTMVGLFSDQDEVHVVDDQMGRPTSAEHLAATSLALLESGAAGVGTQGMFHVCDSGECSWHGFAAEINRLHAGGCCRVEPCSSDRYPRPAQRPAYSVLDLSRAEAILAPMPDWKSNLAAVLSRYEP